MEICHGRGKGGGNFDVWTSSERVTLQALGLDNGPAKAVQGLERLSAASEMSRPGGPIDGGTP
jgi:hypothetical protein